VTLQEAVDAVRATFSAVNQAGVSSARITLSPAALGGIKIALSQTPAGLIARVVADHPEAVQTLAQSADELRSSLTQSGVHVLSLEISSSGQHGADGFSRQQGYGAGGPHTNVSAPISEAQQSPPITELTVRLASGSLISVLA
jgi:flagellar hook-length control protein FliK